MENFNTFMQGYFGGDAQPTPIEWFPFDEACLNGFNAARGEYAYVDVGGGKGQNLQAIVEKYGDAFKGGKFMVQDLPRVIDDIDKSGMVLDARIEKLGYDYFTPQLIRGARTYSFENVFHDYNDVLSKEILGVIKEAMIPGYSKLLIPSLVLPDENVPFIMCALDVMLNCTNSGKERSAAQWTDLLESCGFKIVKIWGPPGPGNAVIEAELM